MSNSVSSADDKQNYSSQFQLSLSKFLKFIGLIIIISGLQSYGFYNHFNSRINSANQNLDHLMDEVSNNNNVNKVLNNLADVRRASEDEAYSKEIVQIYERFIKDFLEDPRLAIEEFARITSTISTPPGPLGEESMATLRSGVSSIQDLYADNFQEIIDNLDGPPLYLQPTASIIKKNNSLYQNIMFNHAVYLSIVGDRGEANTIFNDLKKEELNSEFLSLIHYAQARLLYDAFQTEGQFDYYQQSIKTLKESMRQNPGYGQPKLLLEYLLSIDRGTQEVNAPLTGDGSGEAEGERGVIASDPLNF